MFFELSQECEDINENCLAKAKYINPSHVLAIYVYHIYMQNSENRMKIAQKNICVRPFHLVCENTCTISHSQKAHPMKKGAKMIQITSPPLKKASDDRKLTKSYKPSLSYDKISCYDTNNVFTGHQDYFFPETS